MCVRVGSAVLVLLVYLTLPAASDDRFTCCMAGWKVLRGVKLCDAPCCHGYEERVVKMPLVGSPVLCHKLTEEEMRIRHEATITTTTPQPQLDQPQLIAKASVEYEDFLYRHRHFFLRLMQNGYSRKELLGGMEVFLNNISSVLYDPNWYSG
ncbi:hypothetical protein Pcinc_024292 [Petrolisthes cinctipes]|uniref:Uncharacterized protein n=1 Tax=Petrolisthes cinctipes TaxID=88211 RepID=A0AAE1FA71_PETCI|nr:hypothetical protein Pcinc_024292 [Petrolisthes cinctipes]